MKRFSFNGFSKRAKIASIGLVLVIVALAVVPAMVKASFGPNRPTKVYTDGVAGFDHVTFNSFTNVPGIGDERTFFTGKYSNTSTFTDPLADVKDGEELTLNVYVHNNADASLNSKAGAPGVAVNTKVRVALPAGIAKTQQATAYVSADNAQPQTVYDTLDFGAANGALFQLQYVPGSASVRGNYINKPLSDSVVTTGALVGTDALDGKVKGCFKEMVYVQLKVKVKMPSYSISKEVRMKGQTSADWTENKAVKPGDTTQWLITFKNTGATSLSGVNVVDKVPAGMTVVPGTVKLINGNYPSGYTFPNSSIQDNGRTVNVGIGNYGANGAGIAYVMFDTKIEKPAADVCTTQTLVNKAYATPSGMGAIWDTASVTVPGNECKPTPEKPVYSCDLLQVTKGDNRTVSAKVNYTAKNGASLKMVTYNWGDSKTTTTDKTTASHQYIADGTYKIAVRLLFSVNGKDVYAADNANCAQSVTFTTPTPPVTPPTTPETPEVLPNTGAGSVIGIFAAVTIAGAFLYRVVLSRKITE